MVSSEFERLLTELQPVLGAKLNTLKMAHTLGTPDTRRAIEAWLQLQAGRLLGRRVGESPNLLAPPTRDSVRGAFTLGTVMYHDRELYPASVDGKALLSHVGVFGRTGTGKTNFCLSLLKQLRDKKIPFLIFDWKRNYRDLLSDQDDLRVFTVGRSVVPFSFQPLIPPPGTSATIWLKLLIDVIASAYYVGEGVKFLLMKAIDAVYRETGVYTLAGPRAWPSFRDILAWMEQYRPANARESQWMISTMRTLQSLCYGEMGRVVNKPQQTPLAELLRANVVLELDALTQTDKTFITEALLLWIHHYRMQEGGRETLKHVIIIEEAHHVLKSAPGATESIMEVVLREIRELGQAVILIDQTPSQISPTAMANTATKIFLSLPHRADITTASAALLLQDEQKDILGKLPVGTAVVKLQDRHFMPFIMRIPLVRINKGTVSDDQLAARLPIDDSGTDSTENERIRAFDSDLATGSIPKIGPLGPNSYESARLPNDSQRFHNSVCDSMVSTGAPARSRTNPLIPAQAKGAGNDAATGQTDTSEQDLGSIDGQEECMLSLDEKRLFQDIASHPFDSGVNARYERLGMSTRRGTTTKKTLVNKGLVMVEDVPLPRGKITLLAMTGGGRTLARQLRLPLPPHNTSPTHEYWRHQTQLALERQGYTVESEVRIPGNGLVDLCATKGQERLAIEIETGKSDIKNNLTKALEDGFTGIVVVAVTPEAERKVNALMQSLAVRLQQLVLVWTAKRVSPNPPNLS